MTELSRLEKELETIKQNIRTDPLKKPKTKGKNEYVKKQPEKNTIQRR